MEFLQFFVGKQLSVSKQNDTNACRSKLLSLLLDIVEGKTGTKSDASKILQYYEHAVSYPGVYYDMH